MVTIGTLIASAKKKSLIKGVKAIPTLEKLQTAYDVTNGFSFILVKKYD